MAGACSLPDNAAHEHGPATTEVFIVDDVPSMRERLRELVAEVPDVYVVGDAGTPSDAIAGILAKRPRACSSTTSCRRNGRRRAARSSPTLARHRCSSC